MSSYETIFTSMTSTCSLPGIEKQRMDQCIRHRLSIIDIMMIIYANYMRPITNVVCVSVVC